MAIAQPAGGNAKLASSLLNDWENSDTPRTTAANIVHAQALILLVIDADMRASSTLPFLLARAVTLVNSMKLWKMPDMVAAAEPDSDTQLCVRIWWALVLLDRWHAAGTGKPMLIPESSVVIPEGLEGVVGESRYYLIREFTPIPRSPLLTLLILLPRVVQGFGQGCDYHCFIASVRDRRADGCCNS
jgi:hypothetical protein